jgi:hypothetical protein
MSCDQVGCVTEVIKKLSSFSRMVIFAFPDTHFNMSVEAVGVYVRDFMKRLITDPRHRRGPDGKYHHHQEPCSRLQEYITCYVPPNVASDITQRLMRHVSLCYNELINGTFKIACEEIAPHVLQAVIHPPVRCLDVMRNEAHPTLLDYYKDINIDLIYRTLPLLQDLKALRLGKITRIDHFPLEVEGFRNTLEEFVSPRFWYRNITTLARNCKYIKRLDVGGAIIYTSMPFNYISRFKYIEELNISQLYYLPVNELERILLWLGGSIASADERSEEADNFRTRTGDTSEGSGMYSVSGGSPTYTARNPGLLKSFGCLNATYKHINLISKFYNLTSLLLNNSFSSVSLAPLRNLKLLKNITLMGYIFCDIQEFLKSMGNQLICLNLTDILYTDLSFISEYCRSLECLHICFSFDPLLSTEICQRRVTVLGPMQDFAHVVHLQLYSIEINANQDVLKHFPKLRKLSIVFTGGCLCLESLIRRHMLTRLEELYWGKNIVIHFNGSSAIKTVFSFGEQVTVQHIQM